MFRLFTYLCNKSKPKVANEVNIDPAQLISSGSLPQNNGHASFMFVRSQDSWQDLDITQFINGNKNKKLQEIYQNAKRALFYDPSRPDYEPTFKIYSDLSSLKKSRAGKADYGLAKNGAYILCFDEPAESVYTKIEGGIFSCAIKEVINYDDFVCNNRKQEPSSTIYTNKPSV